MGTTSLYTQARRLALTAGALLTCSLLIGPASFARTSAVVTVSLTDTAPPSPAVANVAPGDSITFVNTGKENHDIVSARAGFTTPVLLPGQSASVTMNTIGKFTYKQTGFTHSFSGSIVVASPSAHGRLTLTSSNAFVPYGFRTTLHVSTSLSDGTPLVLFSSRTAGTHAPRKCVATAGGQAPTLPSGWVRASAPVAVSGGAVAFGVRPAAATSYRVTTADGAACSGAVVVKVRPRLTIRL
ncbi:MAG TPA: hypothetical protein VGU02_02810, partial [Gaiellaceae bacterium]|nr:hypothetical protein [Gaiellaceae bacterium]